MAPFCRESLISLIRPQPPQKISLAQTVEMLVQSNEISMEPVILEDATVGEVLATRIMRSSFPEFPVTAVASNDSTERIDPMVQLTHAADLITQHGISVEGIFRLTKSLERPEELASIIAAGTRADMEHDSPYDLASMLKIYTRKYYPNILSESDITSINETGDAATFLSTLTAERRRFLALLGALCRTIDSHQETNKMSMSNLARVLAPNLFQHPDPMVEMRLILPTIEAARIIMNVA
ncbi:Rho GTPase-activating protein 1 [Paramicrosporidium saccamoebae]|uniref:Rho GTPase-activating protein 1 n=1 Tax=Paramicrosporidium saccamoebae TaxID=1246581 RepID=A0A2H9TPC4_9FUNG|nr:Rho GTPase-activating protein 1 [Paramicrosporidium saccamoebae]